MGRVTDKERRDAARMLRSLRGLDYCKDPRYAVGLASDAIGASHSNGYSWDKMLARLADLIEPSDGNAELCARCDYFDYCNLPKCSEQDGYSFKPKGYTDLLVLADKTIASARHDMEVCGDTVPAWYAAGRLENIARGIREILGVSDDRR